MSNQGLSSRFSSSSASTPSPPSSRNSSPAKKPSASGQSRSSSPNSKAGAAKPPATAAAKPQAHGTAIATASTSNAADHIGGLQITKVPDGSPHAVPLTVEDNSETFWTVTAAINLGLRMLESDRGKHALVDVGVDVINKWTSKNETYIFPIARPTPADMTPYTTAFLRKMRDDFVPVQLTNHVTGEGEAMKFNWAQGIAAGQPNKTLADYVASKAGVMRLSKLAFESIIEMSKMWNEQNMTQFQRSYENHMFMMGVAVAHELVHLFVGFLSGSNRPHTPSDVSSRAERYNKDDTGESGRRWEWLFFGGVTEHYVDPRPDPNDPL